MHGLVVGPASISAETNGSVSAFAKSKDPMLKRLYRARQAAVQQLRSGNVDAIASHFALYTAPLGSWLREVPLTVHFHGPWAAESNVEGSGSREMWAKRSVERRVYRQAKRLIVLSRAFQNELVSRYGIEEERTRIIPGGIDTERFGLVLSRAEARERLGWPEDRPILLSVRRLVRRMGLENLIDAMRLVVAASSDALLLMAGAGPLSEELQARIKDRGLEQNVRLLGRISEADLPLAYRAADITVVPTQALEGFGMITLESLASGTPVLVTPVGGLPEVIAPFAPQCVFASTSMEEIGAVLCEVLQGQRRVPSENACREYAAGHFGWPEIAARVGQVYREAALK